MRYKACFFCSITLYLITFSYCSDVPESSKLNVIPIDTQKIINQILQNDILKKFDTANLVYKLSDDSIFISGKIIRRRFHVPVKMHTNDSISINVKDAAVKDVLKIIKRQASKGLTYDPEILSGAKKVTLKVKNWQLHQVMDHLCQGQQFRYFIENDLIILEAKSKKDTISLLKDNYGNCSILAPKEAQLQLKFPNGTRVWLNAGTVFTFSGDLTTNNYCKIVGEAFLKVQQFKDSLTIHTQNGHKFILRKGSLDLNTFDESGNYIASLEKGEADLYCGDGRRQIKLNGNACITGNKELKLRDNCEPTMASAWTKGFFEQDTTVSLTYYFESMGRWFDVDSKYLGAAKQYSMEGHIPLESNLQSVLALLKLNGIKYKLGLVDDGGRLSIIFM